MPTKISQLPLAVALTGAELVPLVQSGVTDQSTPDAFAERTINGYEGFYYDGTGASPAIVRDVLRSFAVNAVAWGVPNDGTDGTTEMAALMAAHLNIFMPPGNYLFSSALTLRNGHTIIGAGRLQTIITSGVIGDSLFKNTGSYTGFIYMSDMQLIGNGLTGASGNGHAINFIDPAIGSGSFTPAQCVLERLYIRDFAGLDRRDNVPTAFDACAIICVGGLGNVFRDISIETCGHGFYMQVSQNCRIIEPLITGCAGWGVMAYDNENLRILGGDINTCGTDGVTNVTGYPEAGLYTGNVLSARDDDFQMLGTKTKGSPGLAQVHSFVSSSVFRDGWYRADHGIDKDFIGVQVTQPVDVTIDNIDFSPTSGSAYAATRKIYNVKASITTTHNISKIRVSNNQFRTQGGTLVGANVYLLGASNATRMEGIEVTGNSFGMPQAVASAVTVDADVLLDTGVFAKCKFQGNSHYDATNVTKTAHYKMAASNTEYRRNDFSDNAYSSQTSGAISPIFSGFNPWVETIVLNRTYTLADAGNTANKSFVHSDAGTPIITIPANSAVPFPIGTKLPPIINLNGAGAISLAITTDTMRLAGAGTTGTRTIAANGIAYVEKVAATEWIVSGTGVS